MKKRSLQSILNGTAVVAHRRAFKKMLPFAVSKNGKVLLVYPDYKVLEATSERLDHLSGLNK